MARRKNYGFEKKQREIQKQKKKEKKAQRRGLMDSTDPESGEAEEGSQDNPLPPARD